MPGMASNAEYLLKVPLFQRLAPATLASFANACVRIKLGAGEVLFWEGDPGGSLYVIVSGRIRIERVSESGDTQVLGMRGPGEFIGEMSLIDGMPRSASAVAASACRLLVMQKSAFEMLILTEPTATLAIMESMSRRIREAAALLVDLRSKQVWERLLDHLTAEAGHEGIVDMRSSQTALAETLGCTREAANRALRRLEGEGRIARLGPRKIRVV